MDCHSVTPPFGFVAKWSLQKRGKVWYLRFNDGAKDCKLTTGQTTRAAATRWATAYMGGASAPRVKAPALAGYDWEAARDLDVERCVNKGRSDIYIENDVRQRHALLAFFQGKNVITRADLEAFRDVNRRSGRKDESTRRAVIVLRRAVKLLTRRDVHVRIVETTDNPDLRQNEARDVKRKGSYIPEPMLRAWLANMKPAPRAMAVVMLTTGMRWGEVRRLTSERLSVSRQFPGIAAFVSLPEGRGKDKTGRTMALCTAAYEALLHLWATKGEPIHYDQKHSWRATARRVKLKAADRPMGWVHERDMRHNFATCNGERWEDIVGLMRAMGHLRTSHDRYQSATPRRLVKFALHAAQTYGLATSTGDHCSKIWLASGTFRFLGHFLKVLQNPLFDGL